MSETGGGPARGARYYVPAVLASIAAGAIVVAIHRDSVRTLISAHGLLHTAVAQLLSHWWPIARPENPFYAGQALPYYWFYHYVAARIAAVLALHPLAAFEILSVLASTIVWLAGAAISRRLGEPPARLLGIGFFAFAGANAFGGVFLLAKLAAGRPWPADDGLYLWGLPHPVMGMARWNDPGALYGPLVNFFLNNSSRALALSLSLVVVLAVLACLERRRGWWTVVLAAAACTAFSPIVGLLSAAAIAFALAADWVWSRTRGSDTPGRGLIAALIAGVLAPLPTYYHLFGRSTQPEVAIGLRVDLLGTIAVSTAPLFAVAAIGLIHESKHRTFLALLGAAAALLLAGNALLAIPGSNESDLSHVAVFLLAIPAGGVFRAFAAWPGPRRWAAGGAIVAFFAFTPAIVLWSYWHRPPVPLRLDGARLRLVGLDDLERVYEWIRTTTPDDAVFVVGPDVLAEGSAGNIPSFPALTNRVLFVSEEPDYLTRLYPDAPRRRALAASLTRGPAPGAGDVEWLRSLRRPLFLLIEDTAIVRAAVAAWSGPAVFTAGSAAVFRLPD